VQIPETPVVGLGFIRFSLYTRKARSASGFFCDWGAEFTMNQLMALPAYGNQVLLRVVAGVAAELFVMDFEVGPSAAKLASPPITT